jgi:hypothetical protein
MRGITVNVVAELQRLNSQQRFPTFQWIGIAHLNEMAVATLKGWFDIDEVVEYKLAQQVINRIPVASL